MSKNGGLGSKRIGSMTSKGMGKCSVGGRAEQCGNANKIDKGRNENIEREKHKTYFTPEPPVLSHGDHFVSLQNQLASLEVDLNKIKEKLIKLKGE